MKKLITILFALVCTSNIFAHDCKVGGLYYKLWSNTAEVTYKDYQIYRKKYAYPTEVVIPSNITVKGKTYIVTEIGIGAFQGCTKLKSVVIPSSVKAIYKDAFNDCNALTSVTIPNSVTYIGERAFYSCAKLTTISLPNSVQTIEKDAFAYSNLTSITIPNSVTKIGDKAFYYSNKLTSITIENAPTSIGKETFGNCVALTSVSLGNSVTTIEEFAFYDCENLASIVIPNSVTYVGSLAFLGTKIKDALYNANCFIQMPYSFSGTYVIPDGIKTICDMAFSGLDKLTSITIPNSVTKIGHYAFSRCKGLKTITIPPFVSEIGQGTFSETNITSVLIPSSVKKISAKAFADCKQLKDVFALSPNIDIGSKTDGYENGVFKDCYIENLYCAKSVDLSYAGGTIKNIHRLENEELALLGSFSNYAQQYVESRINQWQKKGDYEKTTDWQKRVNESSRKKKVDEFLKEAKQNYLAAYKKRQTYQFSLGSYDPDNEVYLVKEATLGDLLVPVSIGDAQYVRNNWSSMKVTPQYAFSGNEVILKSVGFVFPNNKSYAYKPTQNLTYTQADIQYNFDPIDLNLGTTSSSSQPKGQQTIQQKQLTIGKSAVDTNIPVTNTQNANTFVVIIANENYQSVAKVPFANNDGEILSQYCNKTLGIPTDNIHIYKDATYNNMRSAIAWLETVCRSYDGTASVIFYYTGHGIPDESNKTAYLLPVDGDGKYVQSGIALDEVYSKLGAMPSKSITILLDACFSGATRDGAMLASAKGVAIKVKKGTPVGNTVALTAAQGDETAGFYEEQGHGLFTYFLLKKLQDTKGDVTLEQLSNYISTEVKRRSAVQGKVQTPCVTPASSVVNSWQCWKLK